MMRIGSNIIPFVVLVLVLLNVIEIESSSEWVYKCREHGFDPVQLACKTCTLLLEYASSDTTGSIKNEQYNHCIQCCSSYMDIERITKPFKSAVVVLMTSKIPTEGELGNFFKDDWESIIDLKGTTKITKIFDETADAITRQRELQHMYGGGSMFQMFSSGGFGRSHHTVAEVLFFDDTLVNIKTITKMNYETMSKIAKETIPLSDMKREDMKDMIMTLLP